MPRSITPSARRWRRLKRVCLVLSVALLLVACFQFFGLTVSSDGTHEWIAGRSDASPMIVPLVLFLAGLAGVALTL